jgi:hypothetical protein
MSDLWTKLGEVVLLQVQTGEMTGAGSYDTDMLISVDRLRLTPDGVHGLSGDEWIMDRHHRDHPATKRWHAEDVVSFGFTSHYHHMWNLFRRTPLGIAGENVIVSSDQMVEEGAIGGGLRLVGDSTRVLLPGAAAMEPCVEFSRFMADRPEASAREIKPDRMKLGKGVRGYATGVESSDDQEIGIGYEVFVRSE